MAFSSWLQWLKKGTGSGSRSRQGSSGRAARARFAGRLEALEDRWLPSTFTVMNLNDSGPGSLRAAIAAANVNADADVIKFAAKLQGTIKLSGASGELGLVHDVTINGPGAGRVTVSGDGATRVFRVSGGDTDVTIRGLTVANGQVSAAGGTALGGGLLNEGANVVVDWAVFKDGQAVGQSAGGGAVASVGGRFTALNSTFIGNAARGDDGRSVFGGAVYADQGAVVKVVDSLFTVNQVVGGNANGGAVGAVGGSNVTVAASTFRGNRAVGGLAGRSDRLW